MSGFEVQWSDWCAEAAQRGCDPQQIFDIMIERLGKEFSVQLMNTHFPDSSYKPKQRTYGTPRFDFSRDHIVVDGKRIEFEVLSEQPPVVLFKGILTDAECDDIIGLESDTGRSMVRSTGYNVSNGSSELTEHRTSSYKVAKYGQNEGVKALESRIQAATNTKLRQGEMIQILNYQVGEQYKIHNDYFPKSAKNTGQDKWGNRTSTVLTYLNDVDKGGTTSLPNLNLTIQPKKGDALYFEYMDVEGKTTNDCLHSGDPVESGEKWVATKWLREREYNT